MSHLRYDAKDRPDIPGASRLDITFPARPTEGEFNPEKMDLTTAAVRLKDRAFERVTVHHNWRGEGTYQMLPGRITITSHDLRVAEAFTYGGELTITDEGAHTVATLTSPAPILELRPVKTPDIPMLLATETEVLLAQRRAIDARQAPYTYDDNLTEAEPATLYASCILALEERTHPAPDFVRFIEKEAAFLRDTVEEPIPPLMELL